MMHQRLSQAFVQYRDDAHTRMRLKYSYIGAAFFCLAAHGFAYLNFAPSHDMFNYLTNLAGGWEIQLGRFVQVWYEHIRGGYMTPWLGCILTILFSGLACFLISDLLGIRNRWAVAASAGLMVANATMTDAVYSFVYISDAFGLALLCSCAGAFCVIRWKHWASALVGAALIMLGMGMYQGYVLVGAALILFDVMKHALTERHLWKRQWKNYLRYIACMALTAVLYFVVYRGMLSLHGIKVTSTLYNSPGNLKTLSLIELLPYVKHAYSSFAAFFFGFRQTSFTMFHLANWLLFGLAGLWALRCIWKNRLPVFNILILLVGAAVFPGATQVMSILTKSHTTYFLTAHALYLMYPGLIAILCGLSHEDGEERQVQVYEKSFLMRCAAWIACVMLLFSSCLFSNELYTFKQIQYDKTLSHMTRVLDEINHTAGYEYGQTPVVMLGSLGDALSNLPEPEGYRWLSGMARASVTYPMVQANLVRMLSGGLYPAIDGDSLYVQYAPREDVAAMPCYPQPGYCQMIDDVLVVKITPYYY